MVTDCAYKFPQAVGFLHQFAPIFKTFLSYFKENELGLPGKIMISNSSTSILPIVISDIIFIIPCAPSTLSTYSSFLFKDIYTF